MNLRHSPCLCCAAATGSVDDAANVCVAYLATMNEEVMARCLAGEQHFDDQNLKLHESLTLHVLTR